MAFFEDKIRDGLYDAHVPYRRRVSPVRYTSAKCDDKFFQDYQYDCYVYVSMTRWDKDAEDRLFKAFKKGLKIELAFWGRHRLLKTAIRTAKGLGFGIVVRTPGHKLPFITYFGSYER